MNANGPVACLVRLDLVKARDVVAVLHLDHGHLSAELAQDADQNVVHPFVLLVERRLHRRHLLTIIAGTLARMQPR